MKFIFEKAKLENLEEILNLFENSIKNSCANDYNQPQILAWVSSIENKDKWIKKIKTQYFIITKVQNKIVGFGSLEDNYIDLLYIHNDFLRKGIASFIYQTLKEESKKRGFTVLLTHASKTAISFFESKKFKIIKKNKVIRKGIEITNFEMTQ